MKLSNKKKRFLSHVLFQINKTLANKKKVSNRAYENK